MYSSGLDVTCKGGLYLLLYSIALHDLRPRFYSALCIYIYGIFCSRADNNYYISHFSLCIALQLAAYSEISPNNYSNSCAEVEGKVLSRNGVLVMLTLRAELVV